MTDDQDLLGLPAGYEEWLADLKVRIRGAQSRAIFALNEQQIRLYHSIGLDILERLDRQGWGAKVIDRLSVDLKEAFPNMKGFSVSNLKYMRAFAENCPEIRFGQQAADQLPWFHIVLLLTKLKDPSQREWYAEQSIAERWNRATLEAQIKNHLYDRQGAALTNFQQRLAEPQASLAAQVLKDPYHFDFLGLGDEAQEQDIENALVRHITRFLMELGAGFAFVGRQVRLEVAGDEFFVDLLFYHIRLKCYVVVELKAIEFRPAHAGQLNFYLSTIDAQMKGEDDRPTIGLLLCRTKNKLVAEYALSGIDKPIGIAEYELVRSLPSPLDRSLPSIEEIEAELTRSLEGEL